MTAKYKIENSEKLLDDIYEQKKETKDISIALLYVIANLLLSIASDIRAIRENMREN